MNQTKVWQGILALFLTSVLSIGVIWAAGRFSGRMEDTSHEEGEVSVEEISVKGSKDIIRAARKIGDDNRIYGYTVAVKVQGYQSVIELQADFMEDGKTIEDVVILSQEETPQVGGKIGEESFLSRFRNRKAPFSLGTETEKQEERKYADSLLADKSLASGIYTATARTQDNGGFTDEVVLEIKEGEIVSLVWDAYGEDGSRKSILSEEGSYQMTEEGLTWKQQAEALASAVIQQQKVSFLEPDKEGKTEAVSGVSISISPFVDLLEDALRQAAGLKEEENTENTADTISGATISSTAVIKGINRAYEYLREVIS